jgi:hypothetical protein
MIEIHWNPDARALRRWGVIMAIVTGVAGALFRWVSWGPFAAMQGLSPWLWGLGAVALVCAGTGSPLGRPVYRAWMGFAWLVGTAIGTVALGIVFFLVVTPLAFVARLVGRDRLELRRPASASMWRPLPNTPHDPERQF